MKRLFVYPAVNLVLLLVLWVYEAPRYSVMARQGLLLMSALLIALALRAYRRSLKQSSAENRVTERYVAICALMTLIASLAAKSPA